jgi:hypothetical protein
MTPEDLKKFKRCQELEYKAYGRYFEYTGCDFKQIMPKEEYAEYQDLMKELFEVDV